MRNSDGINWDLLDVLAEDALFKRMDFAKRFERAAFNKNLISMIPMKTGQILLVKGPRHRGVPQSTANGLQAAYFGAIRAAKRADAASRGETLA